MVAKIRPLTRKSGWPMCAISTAPSMARAMRRKTLAFNVDAQRLRIATRRPAAPTRTTSTSEGSWWALESALRLSCLTLLAQGVLFVPDHRLDELDPPEAHRRPVLVDRHHPDRFEPGLAKRRPSAIAVELTLVFLRAAFRVGKPHDGIAFGSLGDRLSECVDFLLLRHERD